MKEYSIEIGLQKVYNSKTREYLEEVVKSYYNESYRSAVVMLYSISLADLLFKLEDLKLVYGDINASEILDKIHEIQSKNPTSPEWENKLIDLIRDRTNLLEPSDLINIQTLQKQRHLCAHPILTQNYVLYKPNKETTSAFIRNCLEGIFTKPPLLSRDIFDDFVDNLSQIKDIILNDADLEKHIISRYLSKINFEAEKQVFRSLWRITFKVDNLVCNDNRNINLKALKIILDRSYRDYLSLISSATDYYSDFSERFLMSVIDLLNQFPEIYKILNDSAQVLIRSKIHKDFDLETYAWFITGDIIKHMNKILKTRSQTDSLYNNYGNINVTSESILSLHKVAVNDGHQHEANKFIIKMFGYSMNYNTADTRYENLIKPNLMSFSKDELNVLVKCVNENSQIYDRRAAWHTNNEIKRVVDSVYEDSFDWENYDNFIKSIHG